MGKSHFQPKLIGNQVDSMRVRGSGFKIALMCEFKDDLVR